MADQSSVGAHLAELYTSIHTAQQRVEDAKAKVNEEELALAKVKNDFADYLKQVGVYNLLAPEQAQSESFTADGSTPTNIVKERRARTSSADRQAEIERNRATYVSEYPLGLDDKTGLPKRYKGRGSANDAINAQMKDDEREYEAKNPQGAGDKSDLNSAGLKENTGTNSAATTDLVEAAEESAKQIAGVKSIKTTKSSKK
jgi:hypothetical protein